MIKVNRNSPSSDLFNRHLRISSLVRSLVSGRSSEVERVSVVVETWMGEILQAAFEGRKQVTVKKNFETEEEFEETTKTSCETIKEYLKLMGYSIKFQWGYPNRGFLIKLPADS